MKMIVTITLALVAVAAAIPVEKNPAELLSSYNNQNREGYGFGFETEDGTKLEQTGELKQIVDEENKPHDVVIVRGFYRYNDPDNKPVEVTYYADDTGFHAEGDSIPKVAGSR